MDAGPKRSHCGGVLISKKYFLYKKVRTWVKYNIFSAILTAAHCLQELATCRLVVSQVWYTFYHHAT